MALREKILTEVVVLDNVIPVEEQDKMWDFIQDYRFSWHFGPSNVYEDDKNRGTIFLDEHTIDSFQFTHVLQYSRIGFKEPMFDTFRNNLVTILKAFDLDNHNVYRVKLNMLTNNRKFQLGCYNPAHVDEAEKEHMVIVYYFNDTDGDTWIFNETHGSTFDKLTVKHKISPKKGRAVAFPGKYFHASSNPIDTDVRCVMNINLNNTGKIIL